MRISMNEIWRNLDGPPKNKKLLSYVVIFEFSRPKSRTACTLLYPPVPAPIAQWLCHRLMGW